uniref:FATC domain-containing protein n=1 Tax=Macrostomum lignano TaxID=282301 RepID=A0A1I8FW37_9PLAT
RIFDLLQQTEEYSAAAAGLQLYNAYLSNALPYFNDQQGVNVGGVDSRQMLAALVRLLNHSRKEVYSPCAGVTGLCLRQMVTAQSVVPAFYKQVAEQLGKMLTARLDAGLHALAQVSRCCPRLACIEFRQRLLFQLPHLTGDSLADCLVCLAAAATAAAVDSDNCRWPNAAVELKERGFFDSLKRLFALSSGGSASVSAESRVPQNALALCERLLLLLQQQERLADAEQAAIKQQRVWLLAAVGEMCLASTGAGAGSVAALTLPQARRQAYQILATWYPTHPNLCAPALLAGLTDSAESNRAWLLEFWSRNSGLPSEASARWFALLSRCHGNNTADEDSNRDEEFSASTGAVLPAFCSAVQLDACSSTPDFRRPMFDRPLADCPFRECRIDADWRRRHGGLMTPLFLETQQQQQQQKASDVESGTLRQLQDGDGATAAIAMGTDASMLPLRATAVGPGMFEATQLHPSAATASLLADSQDLSVSTSLLFRSSGGGGGGAGLEAGVERHRRQVREAAEAAAKREHRVTLRRRYRVGDLPDVQIEQGALVTTLAALAQKDRMFGRLLCAQLSQSMVDWAASALSEDDVADMCRRLAAAWLGVLIPTSPFDGKRRNGLSAVTAAANDPALIGCALDSLCAVASSACGDGGVGVVDIGAIIRPSDYGLVAAASSAAHLPTLGALALELLYAWQGRPGVQQQSRDEPGRHRGRAAKATTEQRPTAAKRRRMEAGSQVTF